MKNTVTAFLIASFALPLWAQSSATTGSIELEAERTRLSAERAAIDERFAVEQAACYKKFAVEGCLQESRARRRAQTDDIKRQEAAINDIERKLSAERPSSIASTRKLRPRGPGMLHWSATDR